MARKRQKMDLASQLEKAGRSLTQMDEQDKPRLAEEIPARPRKGHNWREQARKNGVEPTPPEAQGEETWTADIPEHDPRDLADALAHNLQAVDVVEEDLDRLWDWIRADEDKGKRLLGTEVTTYKALREVLTKFGTELYALIEDLPEGPEHVGFGGFYPVTETFAMGHLYLKREARGRVRHLLPQLMAQAEAHFGDRKLIVETDDPAMSRLYAGIGFKAKYLLEWQHQPTAEEVAVTVTGVEDIPIPGDEEHDDGNGPG